MITEASDDDIGDSDFLLPTQSRYADTGYPDWLKAAAKKAGHTFRETGPNTGGYRGHGAKSLPLAQLPPTAFPKAQEEDDIRDDGSPWEYFWDNVVKVHPEEFNDENYDMAEVEKHKKEIMEKALPAINRGTDEVEAVIMALDEIPGCEYKNDGNEFIGNIDNGEDVASGEEEDETSFGNDTGYGIVIKRYEFNSDDRLRAFVEKYVTPEQFKGVTFATEEEAINALRDYMEEMAETHPSEVYVGSVIDHEISSKIFNGDPSVAGKKGIDASVYSISSSNEDDTRKSISYTSGMWYDEDSYTCDEYVR